MGWSVRPAGGLRNEQAELVRSFSGWADDLWNACKRRYAMIAVRDSETLNILYPAAATGSCATKLSATALFWAGLYFWIRKCATITTSGIFEWDRSWIVLLYLNRLLEWSEQPPGSWKLAGWT